MVNYTCITCGCEFQTRSPNKKYCPSCTGRMGGRPKSILKDKIAKQHPSGYLYYSHSMLTNDERKLLPNDGRCILVHRLTMAKKLGRPLDKGEVVMHIDGNKKNNNPDNLMIGDPLTNSRQHWDARIEAEQWRKIAVSLLGLIR